MEIQSDEARQRRRKVCNPIAEAVLESRLLKKDTEGVTPKQLSGRRTLFLRARRMIVLKV